MLHEAKVNTHAVTEHTYMEDGAVKVHPDPVLLPQVVLELTYLALYLKHGGNVLLRLGGHHCMQLLHLVRALHGQCLTSGTGLNQ